MGYGKRQRYLRSFTATLYKPREVSMSSDEDGVRKARFGIRSSAGGMQRAAVVAGGGWKQLAWGSSSEALVPGKLPEFAIFS